jgi:ferredoxin/flavodoxin
MNISSVSCVYFSPTGTTKAIAEMICQGIAPECVENIDITKRSQRNGQPQSFQSDLVVLATPVYYGRVPEEIIEFLTSLQGGQTPVVLVVVYGNRAFDDALKELHDLSVAGHFIPVAGGAFVAEHSYASETCPIALGRPDKSDLAKAREFGVAVREKLQTPESLEGLAALEVPGQDPYVEPVNLNMIKEARAVVALTPQTDTAHCTKCGRCVEICPTGAISPEDVTQTDRWQCLICFACVKCCPEKARNMTEPNFQAAIQMLRQHCQQKKEPELFL